MSRGIDYGRGLSNIDKETGIRFGVISMNSLSEWVDTEPVYPDDFTCECGKVTPYSEIENDRCECGKYADIPEEPIGFKIEEDGYHAVSCFDNTELMITKSPYYTRGAFCSPCAPGAVNLNQACDDGEKAYCFGHDFFEGAAPYPVFKVDGDELVPFVEGT